MLRHKDEKLQGPLAVPSGELCKELAETSEGGRLRVQGVDAILIAGPKTKVGLCEQSLKHYVYTEIFSCAW